MLKTVIPPLVGAIATSISLTVVEIMNKSLQKMEQFATERRPEPQMLSTVRQLTYENDRLQQYTGRTSGSFENSNSVQFYQVKQSIDVENENEEPILPQISTSLPFFTMQQELQEMDTATVKGI